MNRLKAALLATALAASTTLASCSDGSTHNDADVRFASEMIPHHAQAVAMADLTVGRKGLDPRVARLAEQIRGAQTPEINTMTGWLKDWDEKVPRTGYAQGDGHLHSDEGMGMGDMGDMPGMMSAEDLQRLQDARGPRFQALWLQMMVEHHRGAVEMSQTERRDGEHPAAVALAKKITTSQEGQISTMRDLAGG